jgi:hypothetical protein
MRIAAFTPDGARIVATCDWIPGRGRIAPGSWRIEPDGGLAVDFDGVEPCWDGVLTGTDDGWPLYLTESGLEIAERDLVLRALDDDDQPCGDPLAFTPRRTPPVFDAALATRAADLAIAARGVLDAWQGGDLDAAVRGLAASLEGLRALLPERQGATAPAPQRTSTGEPT